MDEKPKRKQLEIMQERREQLIMLFEKLKDKHAQMDEQAKFIESIMFDGKDEFSDFGRRQVKLYIRRFGFDVVAESAEIASLQYDDYEERFQKLGGIAYNITHKDE